MGVIPWNTYPYICMYIGTRRFFVNVIGTVSQKDIPKEHFYIYQRFFTNKLLLASCSSFMLQALPGNHETRNPSELETRKRKNPYKPRTST